MPRSFSGENPAAEEFFSIVSSGGFKPEHYSDRFQRRAMTDAGGWHTKVLESDSAIKDFCKAWELRATAIFL